MSRKERCTCTDVGKEKSVDVKRMCDVKGIVKVEELYCG